jgi:hypothetical protein
MPLMKAVAVEKPDAPRTRVERERPAPGPKPVQARSAAGYERMMSGKARFRMVLLP